MEWVDKIETMLSMIALTFTGTITLTGETSHQDPENGTKEFLKASAFFNTSIYQQEKEVRSLNISNKILHSHILPCSSISDHDVPYIIAKIPTNKYQTCQKFL